MPAPYRPSSAPATRAKASLTANTGRPEHYGCSSSIPIPCFSKEVKVTDSRYSCRVYVDDRDHMNAFIQHAQPVPPPRIKIKESRESSETSEANVYIKNLVRSMDEAARRKKYAPLRSLPGTKEPAAAHPHLINASGTPDAETSEKPTRPPSRPALQVWSEEYGPPNRRPMTAHPPSRPRTLLNSIEKGRFPLGRTARLSEVIQPWRCDEDNLACQDVFLTSPSNPDEKAKIADRLKLEPIHNWRVFHNLTTAPSPTRHKMHNRPKPKDFSFEKSLDKRRHEFDYVNYSDQFSVDEVLNERALCRDMVIGEVLRNQEGSSQDPLVTLGAIFDNGEGYSAAQEFRVDKRVKGSIWSSIWTRKANEMALERERQHLIEDVQNFKLCVAAASLSKEAVGNLQAELIKTIQKWPCSYKKYHIYTRSDFESWIRKRYNLPGLEMARDNALPSLTECMSSSAEAAFVEYMLSILPENNTFQRHRLLE